MFDLTWLIAFAIGSILIQTADRHAAALTPFLAGAALFLGMVVGTVVYHQAMVRIADDLPHYETAILGIAVGR
ncbi:hypothetical protein U8607_21295 [Methylobacterium durans]|uniref:hypothetical protein n=1 Tax=Methylobacterium durans TaxID=2202825 RepID=UPI002AFF3FBF|nr:hypothetical protein [Methylobacterium durans]MEA1834632.1 hypothetical protein [Methylobacterium durans]